MIAVKWVSRLLARMPFVALFLLKPAYAEAFKDSGWLTVAGEIQQFEERGDYKSAFYALDRYVTKRGEHFYTNSFPGPALKPWFFYTHQMTGRRGVKLSVLWNTISMDVEEFGRNDPIVGYDYAALGEAYAAVKDSQQAVVTHFEICTLDSIWRIESIRAIFDA